MTASVFMVIERTSVRRLAGDERHGFAAVEMKCGGQVGAAEEPGALDFEAGGECGAGEDGVVEQVERAPHLAELAVAGVDADFGNPARPLYAGGDLSLVLRNERGEGCLVGSGGLDEDLPAGWQPAGDGAEAGIELIAGEEVEDVGGVDGGQSVRFEVEFAREAAGADLQALRLLMQRPVVEIVGDHGGPRRQRRQARRAEPRADIENRRCAPAAELHEDLAERAELV